MLGIPFLENIEAKLIESNVYRIKIIAFDDVENALFEHICWVNNFAET